MMHRDTYMSNSAMPMTSNLLLKGNSLVFKFLPFPPAFFNFHHKTAALHASFLPFYFFIFGSVM